MSPSPSCWHPLVPSRELEAGHQIVAGFMAGEELALWRAPDGSAQAWDNQCPHRGVRLTLGQLTGDRLSCAYHGWQFQAGGGHCAAIPAHPSQPAPARLQVRTWPVAEAAGMVWVSDRPAPAAGPPADAVPAGWHFCRTLTVDCPLPVLVQALRSSGWQQHDQAWRLAGQPVRGLLLDARPTLAFLHVWTAHEPGSAAMLALHGLLVQLRDAAQATPAVPGMAPRPSATRSPASLADAQARRAQFDCDDPNLLNDWLTIGPASALQGTSRAHPYRTRLLGAPLMAWRDAQGVAQARLGDQALQADELPDTGESLMILERYQFLWVCASGRPARALFALPEFDDPRRRIVDCGGIGVAASAYRLVENFLDMAHFPFVHPGFLGALPHAQVLDYQVSFDAATDQIEARDCLFSQPMASAAADGAVLARYRYRVMQPTSAMLYKTCVHRDDELDAICLFVQPVDQTHSIAHVLLLYFEDQLTDTELIAFQQMIFGQDKPILENHRHPRLVLDARVETPTRADATSIAYRRWLVARGQRYGIEPAAAR